MVTHDDKELWSGRFHRSHGFRLIICSEILFNFLVRAPPGAAQFVPPKTHHSTTPRALMPRLSNWPMVKPKQKKTKMWTRLAHELDQETKLRNREWSK